MLRRSAINPKRDKPRRNDGRVAHQRIRPKRVEATADEKRYHAWLRRKGVCQACGTARDLVIHHLLADAPGKVGRRDHFYCVLLCTPHHAGNVSVHGLGSERAFHARTGVDLVAIAVRNLGDYRRHEESK